MTDVVFASLPRAAMAFAEALGVGRATLLAQGGLTMTELEDPDAFVAYDRLLDLWDYLVLRFAGRPIGMEYGDALPLAVTGVVGQVCANAPTLRASLDAQLRYTRLLDPRLKVGHVVGEAHHRLTFAYDFERVCAPEIFEMLVTTTVRFARALSLRDDLGPARVCFAHARRHPVDEYERRTRCPARFEAGWTGIEFAPAYLEMPLPRAQPEAQRYLARHADRVLSERATRTAALNERVRRVIEAALDTGVPSFKAVAQALALSERTLQRRLEERGTSFSAELDAVRKARALALAREARLTVEEVAFALGYADPRAFHRAFRRWTGTTPGRFRAAAKRSGDGGIDA